MEFDREVIHFNIFDTMKYPTYSYSFFAVSVINLVVQEIFELNSRDKWEVALTKFLELETNCEVDVGEELKNMLQHHIH